MSRVTDSNEWRKMWDSDKRAMIDTMRRNLAADITAGYSMRGRSVQNQIHDIDEYEYDYFEQIRKLDSMSESEANKWCFYDMKRRGAIE